MNFYHLIDGNIGKIFVYINQTEAGYIQYKVNEEGNLIANGTLVYDEFRSYKLGTPLFNQLINYANQSKVKIYPTCPYVVKMFQQNPEFDFLLDDRYLSTLA